MIRAEHEAHARACMSCGEVRDTILIALRSGGGQGYIRVCVARCWPVLVLGGNRVANGDAGDAEVMY